MSVNSESRREEAGGRRSTDNLRDGESLFLSLVHSIPACFVRKDRDGKIVFVNERFAKLTGTASEDMIGKTVADFYPEQFAIDARREDERVMRSGEVIEDVFDDEVNGKVRYFASRKGPVWNDENEVIGIQTIFWDITEQRLAENALLAEREELRIAKDAADKAKDAADQANRSKSDFLANMSHEIRTPMNAIIGMTDLLLETQLTQTQQEYLSMVQDSGEALLTLINDILDFSKIEAGKFELENSTFDIRDSLGDTMKGLGFRAHDKGLELAIRVDQKIPRHVRGDVGRIRQIVVNLVGNAIKFTDKGEVVLHIEAKEVLDDHVILKFSVIDTGIGIEKEHCSRVFKEFEQADASTTRRFGGTGLGLAISSRLLELMGGRIWVESEIGKGSNFQFELPLAIDHSQPNSQMVQTHVNIQGVRVLVVDDNATNRRILKDMLSNWGMQPTTSSGGKAAIQALFDAAEEDDSFQLIISDVNMPNMNGVSMAKEILEKSLIESGSIIMLSSGLRSTDTKDLNALGISQLLLKPAKQSEIYDAIVSSLSASGMAVLAPALPAITNLATTSELQVLLAEDNIVNQKLAIGILQKLGHRVTVAGDGKEALDILQDKEFDLVLMDVQMPEMDGLAATREIRRRESGTSNHVSVVAMTAHAMKGDRENCLDAGMDDYLSKPIRLKEMANKLAELFPGKEKTVEINPDLNDKNDPIQWNEALANVANDESLLCDLLRVFAAETPILMTQAEKAVTENNAKGLSTVAHSLKGSMLFLNPKSALESAQKVEDYAAMGDLDSAKQSLRQLQTQFPTLLNSIELYLDNS